MGEIIDQFDNRNDVERDDVECHYSYECRWTKGKNDIWVRECFCERRLAREIQSHNQNCNFVKISRRGIMGNNATTGDAIVTVISYQEDIVEGECL